MRVAPPVRETVSVRYGATVMFAWYSKIQDKWFMSLPGGLEENIAPPQMWFCSDEWARDHVRDLIQHREKPMRLRWSKIEQLQLI